MNLFLVVKTEKYESIRKYISREGKSISLNTLVSINTPIRPELLHSTFTPTTPAVNNSAEKSFGLWYEV